MTVKPPNTTEVYYKKNLRDIVKTCGASLILSNRHMFQGHHDSTVCMLSKLMEDTAVEWFCVSPNKEDVSFKKEEALGPLLEEEATSPMSEWPATEEGTYFVDPDTGMFRELGWHKEKLEEIDPGSAEDAAITATEPPVELDMLDRVKPTDVAFMQFTASGEQENLPGYKWQEFCYLWV